jgi:hypothetical protein
VKRLSASLLLASLLSGCGQTETHQVAFRTPMRPATSEVALFIESVPARPYAEMGLLQAIGYGTEAEVPHVMRAIERDAKRMGCDAVAMLRTQAGMGVLHGVGVCVVYLE